MQDELLGQAACGMARTIRSFACLLTDRHRFWQDFPSWTTSRRTIFFISGASRLDGPQHAQSLSVDLPIASVFFPASSWPPTQLVRVNVSRDARTYFSCNLKLSVYLRTHYSINAHASPPQGAGRSFGLSSMGPRLCSEKVVTHPAPCLPKASRALTFVLWVSLGKI